MNLIELLKDTWLDDCVQVSEDGKFTFDYYVSPEGTADENWDLYCEISESLREKGYEFEDSSVEHDWISGSLRPCSSMVEP